MSAYELETILGAVLIIGSVAGTVIGLAPAVREQDGEGER